MTNRAKRTVAERIVLFVAEGFGAGRFPVAPGTAGTLVGFFWIWVLLRPGNLWVYLAAIVLSFPIAVWIGGRAEQIMGKTDPGCIVIDEIAALPVAFLGAVLADAHGSSIPPLRFYLSSTAGVTLIVTFVGFRFFDVAKPWVIGRSQKLPGGWGLVTDDYLAALHVLPFSFFSARFL